jgi:hypothetical protein
MGLPLYVTCYFSLAAFNILFFLWYVEWFNYNISGVVSFLILPVWCSETSCSWMTLSLSNWGIFDIIF